MTTEQRFFLRVLRDYLHGTATEAPADLDRAALLAAAELHKLEGVVYAQCRALPEWNRRPDPITDRFSDAFGQTVLRSTNLESEDRRIRAALREAGISFLPVKGPEVAAFYPDPALRTMSDVDLLIHAADAEAARAVLERAGWSLTEAAADEWIYLRGSLCYELHAVLLRPDEDDLPARVSWFNDFWRQAEDTDDGPRLNWNFHFLYLVAHVAKHIRGRGIGFRQFFDLAVLIHRGGSRLDWARIAAEAEAVGLQPFLRTCMALCERWFGIVPPISPAPLSESLVEQVTEKTFRDGVFGFGSPENNLGLLEQGRKRSRLPLPLLKLKTSAGLLFPPYRQLIAAEKYSYLRGRPWLLPWAWVRRMAAAARNPRKTALVTTVLSATDEAVEARRRRLEELGL